MISAVAPPGMPIECGMTASRTQGPVNLGPGKWKSMIMGCLARNANKPWDPGKQLPLGFSASRQIKKKIKHKLQATGAAGRALTGID